MQEISVPPWTVWIVLLLIGSVVTYYIVHALWGGGGHS